MKKVIFGDTGLEVSRIALGGSPFGFVNLSNDWNPYTTEGREKAIQTVHAALDAGINYVDTAPAYGKERHSEKLLGEALQGKRNQVVLASKVSAYDSAQQIRASVEKSLACLKTDVLDIIQFHGGAYESHDVQRILQDGPMDMLEQLRREGLIKYIGFTGEIAWSMRPLVESGRFDMLQVTYNLTNMTASNYLLDDTKTANMGVTAMRPMTSGMLQRIAAYLAPQLKEEELFEFALKFVLSDSRVHVIDTGMRFREEIEKNVKLVEDFIPTFDMASFPRLMVDLYRTEDEIKGNQWEKDEKLLM